MKNLTIILPLIYLLFLFPSCDKKDDPGEHLKDVEGNLYKTIKIGDQIWMAENLKTTRLNDNTPIPFIADTTAWTQLKSPAYSFYRNEESYKSVYGNLYNWFAVKTNKLCPTGWHVATDADFNTLELFLGVPASEINLWGWRGNSQGVQMKSSSGWNDPANTKSNVSGFSALPGGYRQGTHGTFNGVGVITIFWTATDDSANYKPNVSWYRRLDALEGRIYKATTAKTAGQYIRCIKN